MADVEISKRAERGLRYRLREMAIDNCKELVEAYVACTSDKLITVAWKCRDDLHAMNTCLRRYNNESAYQELKRRWVDSGQPKKPDWDDLLSHLTE